MKTQFDTILEGQKQVWDFWTDATKKIGEAFKVTEKSDVPNEGVNPFAEWTKIHSKIAQEWADLYAKTGEKLDAEKLRSNAQSPINAAMDNWTKWIEESEEWIRESLKTLMPLTQQLHYQNFTDLYNDLYKYWEPMRKMMEMGIYRWEGIDRFFSPKAHQDIVSKFVGFMPPTDVNEIIKQATEAFENFLKWGQKGFDFNPDWTNFNSFYRSGLEVNQAVRQGLDSWFNIAGQGKEVEIARAIKDIQLGYAAFLLKTTELQSMVLKAGQFALPDTLEQFYETFLKSKELPNYEDFFAKYTNNLEGYLIEVLHSDNYSKLQSEVAKTGIQVKAKLDKLVELLFSGLPFLMSSHADEIGKETAALRKKIRQLEARLAKLEKPNGVSNSASAKKTTAKKSK